MSTESLEPDEALRGLHNEAAERAEEAGVVHPAFVDYNEALDNYQARPDVEPLDERRAREVGADTRDAQFRREVGGVDHAGLVTTDTTTDKAPSVVDGEKVAEGKEEDDNA